MITERQASYYQSDSSSQNRNVHLEEPGIQRDSNDPASPSCLRE